MDDHEQLPPLNWDQARAQWITTVAEGILIERYQIPAELARALLAHHAAATDLPILEVASSLYYTRDLPRHD